MEIKQNSEENIIVISVHGKLIRPSEIQELYSHFRLLKEQNINRVVLNLKNLDWMSSTGIGALISCVTSMRNAGGDVRLSNLNSKMQSIMSMTQLDKVFQVFNTIDLAVQSFNPVQN